MRLSLKKKTIFIILAIGVLIGILAVAVYDKGIRDVIETQYSNQAVDIANTVAVEMEADRVLRVQKAVREIYDKAENKVLSDQWGTPEFEEYVGLFSGIEESEDYVFLRDHLRKMQDVMDVDCLYIVWLDAQNECTLYLVDGSYVDVCPPGCIDPIFAEDHPALKNPEVGFPPNITNTPEYGWIVATGMPIYENNGEIVGYAAVDISLNEIISRQERFMRIITGSMLVVAALICLIGILLVGRFIVDPINALSKAAAQYTASNRSFSALNIRQEDEIGDLAESMVRMEKEIDGYIANLEKTRDELVTAQKHAEKMEREANIDSLTKVRNRRAYDRDVVRLNEETHPYGMIMLDLNRLKEINDTCGHEKGNEALKELCTTACRIFKHSPVYRIGGDEFVVLLEHGDYEDREILIEELREKLSAAEEDESLPLWKRVSAAVGCAVYEPGKDENVDSVFKRADAAMYANKKEMKLNC